MMDDTVEGASLCGGAGDGYFFNNVPVGTTKLWLAIGNRYYEYTRSDEHGVGTNASGTHTIHCYKYYPGAVSTTRPEGPAFAVKGDAS